MPFVDLFLVLMLIFLILVNTYGFPAGQVDDECGDSVPTLIQHLLQSRSSPYVMYQTSSSYKPGQVINVSIKKWYPDGPDFESVFVQALERVNSNPIGRFLDAEGLDVKGLCSAVVNERNPNRPQRITGLDLAWVAPIDQKGDVIFRAVIVERKGLFHEILSRPESSK